MSFFEVPPADPEPNESEDQPPAWSGPPDGVLPAFSTQRAVLARSDSVLVAVDQFRVYPNGLVFTLTLVRREDDEDLGHVPWEIFRRRNKTEVPDDFMRLGILFGDGSKWTNLDGGMPLGEEEISGPVVMGRGGGGGGKLWEMGYWVWPLPPPGEMTFVVSWPSEGIAEQAVSVDAAELCQRAADAEQIWLD